MLFVLFLEFVGLEGEVARWSLEVTKCVDGYRTSTAQRKETLNGIHEVQASSPTCVSPLY